MTPMTNESIVHAFALFATFAAVSCGTYGCLLVLARMEMLPLVPRQGRSRMGEASHRLGALAARKGWFRSLAGSVQKDLIRARMVDVKPDDFIGRCLLYAVLAFAGLWALTIAAGGSIVNIIPAAIGGFMAFRILGMQLRSRATRRIGELTKRMPYALQLIVLATEAGGSFEESLGILVREDPNAPLHEEFDQVLRDIHLGLTRNEALRAMAARVTSDDMDALVTALDVAEDLGTPIATTLKKQAEALRVSRITRAERVAREAGPKMALPNTLIMMANVLLILAPFLPKLSLNF